MYLDEIATNSSSNTWNLTFFFAFIDVVVHKMWAHEEPQHRSIHSSFYIPVDISLHLCM